MPRVIDVLRLRIRALVFRRRADNELDRELQSHIERQIEEHVAAGMTADEARRAALSTFGGVQSVREEARDARGVAIVENLMRDLRRTLRALFREPMLVIAATLSIALGAAGNIAVFSLVRAIVFAPPGVRDPSTLINIQVSHGSHVSFERWRDIAASGALAGVAGYSIEKQINWMNGDAAVSIVPLVVTVNFFDVTGTPLALGRGFSEAEARAELDPRVAVVSHEFWRRELRADTSALGRTLMLNGESYVVIGVLPPRMRSVVGFGIAPGIYVPLNRALAPELAEPDAPVVQLLGRLRSGQSLAEGRAGLDAVDRRLERLRGDTLYGGVQEFAPVGSLATGKSVAIVGAFFALLGLVSLFVLLIACANVAGLLIARGTRRRQEIAIRLAIGGSRARVVQQLLIEGFWLALIGTVAGLALSLACMRAINSATLPIPMPIALHLSLDGPILLGALGVVVLTMLVSALLPALQATRLALVPALKRDEPFLRARRFSARGILLVCQVTVSTVLLVTAFLFVRNLSSARLTSIGFDVEHTLVSQLGFTQARSPDSRFDLLDAAVARVRSLPGVVSAAYADGIPLTLRAGSTNGTSARIGNNANPEHIEFARNYAGPGYFATMGIRLIGGREFDATDTPTSVNAGIINETFARRYFRAVNPLGQRVHFLDKTEFQVVGVVSDSKYRTLGESQRAAIYLALRQHPKDLDVAFVVARTTGAPATLVSTTRRALGDLDHSVAVTVEPMSSALQFALLPSRIGAALLGTLGLLGLVLAAFGLYAIVSYNVSRRISEIAIRSALGASRGALLRLVVRDASLQVGLGLALGLGIAALVTAPLSAFLIAGLSATDPASFGGTAIVFLAVSALASLLPARQATRISPVVAMRLE